MSRFPRVRPFPMLRHADFTSRIHIPREKKGAIENMNRLIRQNIPQKADFKGITEARIRLVIEKLKTTAEKEKRICQAKRYDSRKNSLTLHLLMEATDSLNYENIRQKGNGFRYDSQKDRTFVIRTLCLLTNEGKVFFSH